MSIRSWFVVAAAVFSFSLLANDSFAQRPGGNRPGGQPGQFGRGGPGGGISKFALLRAEAVQKELEISDDQKADLQKLSESSRPTDMRETFAKIRELPEDERRAKYEEIQKDMQAKTKEAEAKIADVLLPHQITRLDQIALQLRGTAALREDDVAKKLGITEEQKTKLEEVSTANREKMTSLFSGNRTEGAERPSREEFQKRMEEMRPKMEAARKEANEAIMGVLTSEQKAQWEKMVGPKVEIDARSLFGGFGQGGRPGQPGQGRPGQGRPQPNNDNKN